MRIQETLTALKIGVLLSMLYLTNTANVARAAIAQRGSRIELSGAGYFVALSAANGDIVRVASASQKTSLWQSGENGLWHARFQDGTVISAHDCQMTAKVDGARGAALLQFVHSRLKVDVSAQTTARGVDFSARLTPQKEDKSNALLDFALPSRLRFSPAQMRRLIVPAQSHDATGLAFKTPFFGTQSATNPASWRNAGGSPAAYSAVWGGALDSRSTDEMPIELTVTPTGREWLGAELASTLGKTALVVNRPSLRSQVDVVLVDSAHGPYFAGSALGGAGLLWRVGGGVENVAIPNIAALVAATVNHVASEAAKAPAPRRKIGLLALKNGPQSGGWAGVTVDEWRARLQKLPVVNSGTAQFIEINSTAQMIAALKDDWAAIVNPYGEWLPVPENSDTIATAQAIAGWVRGGGHWFETGGYSFYSALKPELHFSYGSDYPGSFADFFHFDGAEASASTSLYGVQPQNPQPHNFVTAATAAEPIFVPLHWEIGSDEQGGFLDRHFATFVASGQSWQSPIVRLTVGDSAENQARQYVRDNGFTRRLQDKMTPELLDKWKRSVLVYYSGNAAQKLANLQYLPVPTQIHFADYLHGGFDKELPDHLPPNANFGTMAQMKQLFDDGHARGHLLVPYTNPTWWCDHPRGPTFLREGTAPLALALDGNPHYDKYGANDGWLVTFWHPAVRAVNRKIRAQFVQDLGVDVLFQDQVGARSWKYDLNPSSPTPYAYIDGMVRQASEDAQTRPLSTENGWDRVMNWEAQFCGMSFSTVPTGGAPEWRRLLSDRWPANCWELFPLAQIMAHDKVAFLHHDLGQFVTDPSTLAWTLALGYNMSYSTPASALQNEDARQWLLWLDRIQKSVCARSTGAPIHNFTHDAIAQKISAAYGDVTINADLRSGQTSFTARAPGLLAADSGKPDEAAFIAQSNAKGGELWIYAPESSDVRVSLPAPFAGAGKLRFDNQTAQNFTVANNVIKLKTPAHDKAQNVKIPAALTNVAPRDAPLINGEKRRIGVIDFGEAVGWSWTEITPAMWREALQNSRLAKQFGLEIETLSTPQQVLAALKSGREKYFAIINPHTETIPESAAGAWSQTLDAIRNYVQNGGQWWETGAASFYGAAWLDENGKWQRENIGAAGLAQLGLPMGSGEVAQAAEPLSVGRDAEILLGATTATIAQHSSVVNRGLPRGGGAPDHITLIAGRNDDFIGGYRLNGWGVLWRIGGFNPNPQVAIPTVVASLENGYQRPPLPLRNSTKYLWHATFESAP